MADLNELNSAGMTKLIGADSSGQEQTPVQSSPNGDLAIVDGLRDGGVYSALSIPDADTPVEAKVGVSRLANRKFLLITATSNGLYWGLDSSVTTATGTPLANNQVVSFEILPGSNFQVWLVRGSTGGSARIVETP